jgi:hypothetical protein
VGQRFNWRSGDSITTVVDESAVQPDAYNDSALVAFL